MQRLPSVACTTLTRKSALRYRPLLATSVTSHCHSFLALSPALRNAENVSAALGRKIHKIGTRSRLWLPAISWVFRQWPFSRPAMKVPPRNYICGSALPTEGASVLGGKERIRLDGLTSSLPGLIPGYLQVTARVQVGY